ncbi:MAG: DUF445 family protein [Sedimentisphaerales bacterium]|nr:DUF445 family protein [Sedimentisphaerales bacterium]
MPNQAKIAKNICYTALLLALLTGLLLHFFVSNYRTLSSLLMYASLSGLIGLGTNTLAIKMILDYVYLPFTKIKIPMSGLLPANFSKITNSIGSQIADNILNPETLKNEIRDQECFSKLLDSLQTDSIPPESLQKFQQLLCQILAAKIKTDEFYFQVRDGIVKSYAKQKIALKIANFTGIIDYDDTAYQIIDAINQRVAQIQANPQTTIILQNLLRDFLHEIEPHKATIEDDLLDFLSSYVLNSFDIASAVKNKLDTLSAGDVKSMVLDIASDYLGWIEVWGGVLGTILGIILAALL